jgi:hypothetical protein
MFPLFLTAKLLQISIEVMLTDARYTVCGNQNADRKLLDIARKLASVRIS